MLLPVLRLGFKLLEKRVHAGAGDEVPFQTPAQGHLPLTEKEYAGLDPPLEKFEIFC